MLNIKQFYPEHYDIYRTLEQNV